VIAGKIAPYLMVAAVDLTAIVLIGMGLFGVPFTGNVATFALGAALFLLVTLGIGVLISTVSQNQGQAIQLAFMIMLPQVLLSGLIFPVGSMAPGVRWISYVLPLTYFIQVSRGVMLKATPISALGQPLGLLALLAVVVLGLAIIRFRRDLAPGDLVGFMRLGMRPQRHSARRGEFGHAPDIALERRQLDIHGREVPCCLIPRTKALRTSWTSHPPSLLQVPSHLPDLLVVAYLAVIPSHLTCFWTRTIRQVKRAVPFPF